MSERETQAFKEYRQVIRSLSKAKTAKEKFKQTKSVTDKRTYWRYQKRAQRQTAKLNKTLNLRKRVTPSKVKDLYTHRLITGGRREREILKTKFTRTIKYKDDGTTKKSTVTYRFKDKTALEKFRQLALEGVVPVPRGEETEIYLDVADDWNLRRLISMFRKGS